MVGSQTESTQTCEPCRMTMAAVSPTPRHRPAAPLGLDGLERPPPHEDGVEPRHHAHEVDLRVHDDPVGLAVRPGQIPIEAHSDGIDDLSHQSLLSPLTGGLT